MDGMGIPHTTQDIENTTPRQFTDMLQALRPQGDTGSILVATQIDTGAMIPVGHDGSQWPDYPTHINAGLFEPALPGVWSEREEQCVGCVALVLDDVSEKVGVPDLQPTFIIETKPGSQHWWYVYNEIVHPDQGRGMATAAAIAGASDSYIASRSHYWIRLPQSLPPGKEHRARLIQANGVTYSYQQVADGLGLKPVPEASTAYSGTTKYDPETGETDPLLQWMVANEYVRRGRADRSGWRNVRCPNADQHSDKRQPWGRYVPPNSKSRSAFMCHHSHCTNLKVKHFREAVERWGGPSVVDVRAHADGVQPRLGPSTEEMGATMPMSVLPPGALPLGSPQPTPTVPETAAPALDVWPASTLFGLSVPERVWHVADMVPDSTVTLLGGDGGTGKSLVALHLATSTALGHAWLGVDTRQGAALYLSAEDDKAELHRRLVDIARAEDVALSDLSDLHVASLAGHDALLATAQSNGVMIATALLGLVRDKVAALRPKLVVLDTLADLFGGNENDRSQARQFISMLRGVAIEFECAVMVLAHPSLTGIASGTGSSGSTGWNNSVRSRLYLKRDINDTEELDPDARMLEVMKSNYGRIGEEIRLRWQRGVFVASGDMEYGGADAADLRADNRFLTLLDLFTEQGRAVTTHKAANYAPKVFADHPEANGIKKKGFQQAMERLLASGRIFQEEFGPPSKRRDRLCRDISPPSNHLPTGK